jgi:hypothetical protein
MSFTVDELAYPTELVGRWVPPTPQYVLAQILAGHTPSV